MAKKKYYAVRAGRTPGIYTSWDACKAQVDGFANASFKSFPTKEEAEAFLGNNTKENKIEDEALAYVDGSYNVKTGEYSCGVVFFFEGEKTEYCEKGTDSELAAMRNVAGEILGAQVAMKMAVEQGAESLTIVHDYQGIASWCTGEWKTNKEGTKAYKAYFDSLKDKLIIHFQKVKGHAGDEYNDLADELAKSVIF